MTMKKQNHKFTNRRHSKFAAMVLAIVVVASSLWGCGRQGDKPLIGIAWRGDVSAGSYIHTALSIERAGGTPVLLGQVIAEDISYNEKNMINGSTDAVGALSIDAAELLKDRTWKDSNAKKVMKGIKAVVFTGGEDISPSLYREPEDWHGIFEEINYNATRDVSDYLLMTYCLDHDIPTLGICRGMQMMAVAAGAEMIQDIPAYFASREKDYSHVHRYVPGTPEPERDYVPHDVTVKTDSLAYEMVGSQLLSGCPSLHHQAVGSMEQTGFLVSGITTVSGEAMIEIIEHPEKTFLLGLQFHPEAAVGKTVNGEEDAGSFMSYDSAMAFFRSLVEAAQ